MLTHSPQPLSPCYVMSVHYADAHSPRLWFAIISGTGKAVNLIQIWTVHSEVPSEQMSIKNFGEKRKGSVGVSRDCPVFWVPPIIAGTGKAAYKNTNFKFCVHIYGLIGTKAH